MDIPQSIHNIQTKFLEYSKMVSTTVIPASLNLPEWTPHPLGQIKINANAALSGSRSTLATIARCHRGEVIRGCDKGCHFCSSLQVETVALQLVVEIVVQEHWQQVIYEGDGKAYFGPLSLPNMLIQRPLEERPLTLLGYMCFSYYRTRHDFM